ncbi:M20 aminoacylase family protein [Pseudomonas sp. AKS31]|uniref:M20 aminoacylase family protein n=1 Tax=Pseudomonas sp. AKS31 TaxID=2949091 RepID=UPI002029D749|nr:M20 aminoacylase family protein [Pseudomonas sp. AKS31]MCL9802535.1 M20 family metallopeptidase [Pseudomonas sp. AKS31]
MATETDFALQEQMIGWRRWLHQHPEAGFAERKTSAFIAEILRSFDLQPHIGIGGTGVVATIEGERPGIEIALRADMDALPIQEENTFAHRSVHDGWMHACGHDGHSAMLLGAARQLAADRSFAGKVHLVFQPAEEIGTGAKAMMTAGLFEKFRAECVYGLHNWPGLATGRFVVHHGAAMAGARPFEMVVSGCGCHAAMPHQGADPLLAAAHLVTALQSIVSRNIDPADALVLSVTQFHAGDTHNIVPDTARLGGTMRYFRREAGEIASRRMTEMVEQLAAGMGVRASLKFFEFGSPPLINSAVHADHCVAAASAVAGRENVGTGVAPSMTGEDFAFMLERKPGAYIWIGNGSAEGGCSLHNPRYDFNDEIMPLGVAYWVALVRQRLQPVER